MTDQNNTPETNDLESRIIAEARKIFVEKGFSETSMSEIAERVNINRPTLHYYFRTKERLFHAVFGDIISVVVPKLQDLIINTTLTPRQRISYIVDIYYDMFLRHPYLPMFMLREMHRDIDNLIGTITSSELYGKITLIQQSLRAEMDNGTLRTIPLRQLFFCFYGLLSFPLLTRNIGEKLLLDDNETFAQMIDSWKPCIIDQLTHLLTPPNP